MGRSNEKKAEHKAKGRQKSPAQQLQEQGPPPAPPPPSAPPKSQKQGQSPPLPSAPLSKSQKQGPPPPPPPLSKASFPSKVERVEVPNLNSILSPAALLQQKKVLKVLDSRKVTLTRKEILGASNTGDYLQLHNCYEFLKVQTQTADVTGLDFTGLEQLSDVFLYIIYINQLEMPLLKYISISGCPNVTDLSVKLLCQTFSTSKLQSFKADGCRQLTEVSLQMLHKTWGDSLEEISMVATGVGMIPNEVGAQLQLVGCPVINPVQKNTGANNSQSVPKVEHTCFKMVIVGDKDLPWNPLGVLMNEKVVDPCPNLQIRRGVSLNKQTYNIFQLPYLSPMLDLVLSEASIVVVPFVVPDGDKDPFFIREIVNKLLKLDVTCPECQFLLLGLTYQSSMAKEFEHHTRSVKLEFHNRFDITFKQEIERAVSRRSQVRFGATVQKMIMNGVQQVQVPPKSLQQNFFIQATLQIGNDNTKKVNQALTAATDALKERFPTFFIPYNKDLAEAVNKIEKDGSPFSSLHQTPVEIREFVAKTFAPSRGNYIQHLGKIFTFMARMGKLLYLPCDEDALILSDFTILESLSDKLVEGQAAHKASWRHLGNGIPCWRHEDLANLLPDKEKMPLLLEMLQKTGVVLKMPRDRWTTEIEDMSAYIVANHIPTVPAVDVEVLWPDEVPEDELQIDRMFHFFPSMTQSFFSHLSRECLEMGGVKLLWKTGLIIIKGPVTLLVELLSNYEDTPVVLISARLQNGKMLFHANKETGSDGDFTLNDNPFLSTLYITMKIYRMMIDNLADQHHLYCVDMVPCETCLPDRNRYQMVNTGSTKLYLMRDTEIRQKLNKQRKMSCPIERRIVNLPAIIGPNSCNLQMSQLLPTHHYLGCVPFFSTFNRCLFCCNCATQGADCPGNLENGRTSGNCSCDQDGPVCDKCGLCQRCDVRFSKMAVMGSPRYSKIGSNVRLSAGAKYIHNIELTPNYSPVMEVTFLEDVSMAIGLTYGNQTVKYNTGEGAIREYQGETEKQCNQHEDYICKNGQILKIKLAFSKEDMSDMEVKLILCGMEIYSVTVPAQSCKVFFHLNDLPATVIINTPGARKIAEQVIDNSGELKNCTVAPGLHCQLEATMQQGREYLENALFQAGGVNYSGATYLFLPREITADKLRVPSHQDVKVTAENLAAHLLCYTRSKVSDTLTFSGNLAVPESWSVYRMVHLVNSPGIALETKTINQLERTCTILLWAWNFVYKMLSKVTLPRTYSSLLHDSSTSSLSLKQIETGLADLIDMMFWRLSTNLEVDQILTTIDDHVVMMKQTEKLQALSQERVDETGLHAVTSLYSETSILYLCSGHNASVNIDQGLAQVMPELYGSYSVFLLSVDMPSNQLTEIPEEAFKALPNLKEFDCSRNFIETLPSSISYCKELYSLSVAENNLTDLPDSLVECKKLWRLHISSNRMERIPAVVTKLTWLTRLYAANMFMRSLPEDIGNLVNLDKLYLNGNCFTSLPKSFTQLRSLTDLGLAGIPFTVSKNKKVISFENFTSMFSTWGLDRWMEAHKQEKDALFKVFDEDSNGVLDQVEMGKLNAALFNMFPRFGYKGQEPPEDEMPSGFPMEVFECRSLEYLNMNFQGIVSVPPEIGQLQELKVFNFGHNPNLLTLPAEMGTLSCLTRMELDECPLLKTPPKEIRAKGFATTFAYLKRLSSGSLSCKRTKLMMVGLGGAGKTSLVEALLSKDGKADLTHGEAITDGIDITTWTVKHENDSITYSVWDFAGQTVYYNTHQFFLSNRAVYLLVWNVRLGYEHAGLDFWLSSISVQAPKAPIFVVGSHVDQVSKFEIPIDEMKARYKQIAGFFFVSSYTGQGMMELQDELFEVTLQQQYMGEQIPEVWLAFENSVIGARKKDKVIEYKALEKLANVSGIFEKQEIDQAVQFLHELGSLQHFTTELLKSKVVINPQWIVDVMACIVSVKNSPIHEGRLEHKDIGVVWKDYPEKLHDWLLKLTEEYDLTFPLENQSANLVPCLLQEKPPDELSWPEVDKEADMKENKMIYKFDYLPAGLFNRGQVRLHQISDSALIWKKGSFLKKNGHIALLQQTRASELIVMVQGPRPENVIFLVHEVFEGLIAESFRGVTYDFLIPCPDCLRIYVKDPHMFAASTIRRALELKAPFLQCVKQFHTISCIDLLACMPPDNHADFDVHLVQSVRNLRDLRNDLSADIFFSYCEKDAPLDRTSVIHPATVCDDMKALGYKCWFPEKGHHYKIEEMARALTDASVFVVFMSQDYAKNEECVNIFKYARLTLHKPLVVVAVGDGFEWKQSKLGILLSDEVFVNMIKSKKDVYQSKFDELIKTINNRSKKTLTSINATPTCFFSYTWVNSVSAVALGTKKVPGAIGHGDPREIKQYLENKGIKCWIDIERIGQNGLFDDIAEGLLSAKVVIVCVSDEYASSPTCQIEFRYAANTLKLPIVMVVVGTGSKWRASEVGVLSLNHPLVSFQEKSETAYSTLLELVKERLQTTDTEVVKAQKNKLNEKQKNLSFQELFELAQRKLLRQLCFYAEHQDVDVYPRLFAVDFVKVKQEEIVDDTVEEDKVDEDVSVRPVSARPLSRQLSKRVSNLKPAIKLLRFCVHTLCEHDEGWHSVSEPLPLPSDFGETVLDKFSPFVARITAVMKYNKQFDFNCRQHELGEDYLQWLEENPQATISDYQQIYHKFRQMVLDLDSKKTMGELARCRLPNGKTIWLCRKHRTAMKVTVLANEATQSKTASKATNDMNTIAGLRGMEPKLYADKFTTSVMAKRVRDSDAEQPKPFSLASDNFDLLPDKKMKRPDLSISTKETSKEQKDSENKETVELNTETKMSEKDKEAATEKSETVLQSFGKENTETEAVEPVKSKVMKKRMPMKNTQVHDEFADSSGEKSSPEKAETMKKKMPMKKTQEHEEFTANSGGMSSPEKTEAVKNVPLEKVEKKGLLSKQEGEYRKPDPKDKASGSQDMTRSKTFFAGQPRQAANKSLPTRPSSAQKSGSTGNKSKACSVS